MDTFFNQDCVGRKSWCINKHMKIAKGLRTLWGFQKGSTSRRLQSGSSFGVRAYCVTHRQSSKPFMHTMLSKNQHVFHAAPGTVQKNEYVQHSST